MRNLNYFDKQRGLINLIRHIHDNGNTTISTIRNKAKINYGVAYKCLHIMDDLGLISIKANGNLRAKKGYNTKDYHLTAKGIKVAEILGDIDSMDEPVGKIDYFNNQTGLVNLIIYLLQNKKAYLTEIQRRGKINTVQECLYLLDNWGFIENRLEYPLNIKNGSKTKHYSLTEKGRRTAVKFMEINGILERG